jgi:hypothetical protein
MAVTPTVVKKWFDTKKLFVVVNLVFSGSYVTGGDTVNLQSLGIPSSQVPISCLGVEGQVGTTYNWIPGTTQANGKIFITQGATVQVTAGAYPGSITGDVVQGTFVFDIR